MLVAQINLILGLGKNSIQLVRRASLMLQHKLHGCRSFIEYDYRLLGANQSGTQRQTCAASTPPRRVPVRWVLDQGVIRHPKLTLPLCPVGVVITAILGA